MCTLIILRRPEHDWPVLMAANRDELIDRPWKQPARHWSDRPNVVAGRDQVAGGTWLGINDQGVVAAILNRRGSLGPKEGYRSRGELPLEALDLADKLGGFLNGIAWDESAKVAEERGPFPEYENSALKQWGMPPVRNASVVTIAPTGTISRIAGCSSGIEPHFALAWWSNVLWEDHEGTSSRPKLWKNLIMLKKSWATMGWIPPFIEHLWVSQLKLM